MRDYRERIREDLDWLFILYEVDKCEITKSVDPDREWNYVLKLKMIQSHHH